MTITEKQKINVTTFVVFIFLFLSLFSTPAFALQVDQANIENITEQLTQYNRIIGVEDDKAASYINDRMIEYGLEVHLEEFPFETTSKIPLNMTSSNVIGIKEGASDQIIIIGAHYDSKSYARGIKAPGADDNAVGVAVMLEIARLLQNESFNRTVYFIAFSGEEFGLLGSKNWLEQHEDLYDNIVAMINIDSVAYGDKLVIGSPYSWLRDVFPLEYNLEITSCLLGGDDISFLEENLPAVRLQDVGNPYHHTPDDTIDTLNFSLAKESAEIIATGIYNLAATSDLTPPEVRVEVQNGTIYYNASEESNLHVFVDGMNLGYIESGKTHLPAGEHYVKVRAADDMGNRASDELIVNVNRTYYTVPGFEEKSVVTIPWKRTEEEIQAQGYQKWGQLSIGLGYEIENITDNITVTGFLDGIKIEVLSSSQYVVLIPGKHTFEVAAFNESGIVGFDETIFFNEKSYNISTPSIFYEHPPNLKNNISNLFDTFKYYILQLVM